MLLAFAQIAQRERAELEAKAAAEAKATKAAAEAKATKAAAVRPC
jgi:hypothetical protein